MLGDIGYRGFCDAPLAEKGIGGAQNIFTRLFGFAARFSHAWSS
ncbi:hypothetical protein [Rhizobium wenxiniae]